MPESFSVILTIVEPSHVRLPGLAVATPDAALRSRLWLLGLFSPARRREHGVFEAGLRVITMRAPWARRRVRRSS